MTIEQTVEIPVDHRLTLEVSREIPAGRAILTFTPAPTADKTVPPLWSLVGIDKGRDTMEAYFERHQAEKSKEDENDLSGNAYGAWHQGRKTVKRDIYFKL
jgi:hypothetical protein